MAAQQCRESERLHGIICCYIGFAFFSPCKFQTGNPSRRCALQGSLWAGLAACSHAFLARSPDAPDHGAASPKAVQQRTLFTFSEVWNLLIHKRTANRIFSTTFSIFFLTPVRKEFSCFAWKKSIVLLRVTKWRISEQTLRSSSFNSQS